MYFTEIEILNINPSILVYLLSIHSDLLKFIYLLKYQLA